MLKESLAVLAPENQKIITHLRLANLFPQGRLRGAQRFDSNGKSSIQWMSPGMLSSLPGERYHRSGWALHSSKVLRDRPTPGSHLVDAGADRRILDQGRSMVCFDTSINDQ